MVTIEKHKKAPNNLYVFGADTKMAVVTKKYMPFPTIDGSTVDSKISVTNYTSKLYEFSVFYGAEREGQRK